MMPNHQLNAVKAAKGTSRTRTRTQTKARVDNYLKKLGLT